MNILKKAIIKFNNFLSWRTFYFRKNVIVGKRVKVNSGTCLEDNVKIYHDTKILSSSIGAGTYIGWSSILNHVVIGRFCSIAPFTEVIYGRHAVNEFVSSHPSFYSTASQAGFSFVEESKFAEFVFADTTAEHRVIIGNDVWIGYGVKIMEGVTIGDGAIIGAGSIVTKNVEPYGIYVGVPAKKIKERFSPATIKSLLEVRWWNKDFDWLKQNSDLFKSPKEVISVLQSND